MFDLVYIRQSLFVLCPEVHKMRYNSERQVRDAYPFYQCNYGVQCLPPTFGNKT